MVAVTPETRYAKSGPFHIAYQVVGSGLIDLVVAPGFISNVEGAWNNPLQAQLFNRLASFSRLIRFDKRGTGLSDPVSVKELPTLEERMDDVRAVMDAVGSRRAALLGIPEGGPLCLLFAATYPERTHALILYGTYARWLQSDDNPIGMSWQEWQAMLAELEGGWGGPAGLDLHRSGDRLIAVEHGRYLAEHIADAKLVESPGVDHIPWVDGGEDITSEIQQFLTGVRSMPEPDRMLATEMCDTPSPACVATGQGRGFTCQRPR
jgi:pimeloyl-ACP methyl ester carboxylesterase